MKKVPLHVTISPPIAAALEALAILEGRSVSDILEESGRKALEKRGYLPEAKAEEISAKVKELKQTRKKKRSPDPQA